MLVMIFLRPEHHCADVGAFDRGRGGWPFKGDLYMFLLWMRECFSLRRGGALTSHIPFPNHVQRPHLEAIRRFSVFCCSLTRRDRLRSSVPGPADRPYVAWNWRFLLCSVCGKPVQRGQLY